MSGRRDRAASMIAPSGSSSLLTPQHRSGGRGGPPDTELSRRRAAHGRQGSADWNSLGHAAQLAMAGQQRSLNGDDDPNPSDGEIEGTDVPYAQYDTQRHQSNGVSSPTNGGALDHLSPPASSGSYERSSSPRSSRLAKHMQEMKISEEGDTVDGVEEDGEGDFLADDHDGVSPKNSTSTTKGRKGLPPTRNASMSVPNNIEHEQWQIQPHQPPLHPHPPARLQLNTSLASTTASSSTNASTSPSSAHSTEQCFTLSVSTGSAPGTATTSPTTRERLQQLEQLRPHTTSHAALSARGSGTNFHLPLTASPPAPASSPSPTHQNATFSTLSGSAKRDPTRSPPHQSPGHSRTVSSPSPPVPGLNLGPSVTGTFTGSRLSILTESGPGSGGSRGHRFMNSIGGLGSGGEGGVDSDSEDSMLVGSHSNFPSPPHVPLRGARKLASIIRSRIFPTIKGKWSSGHIVKRFLTHKYGDFDVSSMLAQQFGLEEFRQRMAARLHHLDSSQTIAATTKTMVEMFSSLKTFHRLLDGTSVLNAHLSKRQALQNIISTVHNLLDAEMVTVFLLHKKSDGTVAFKAVSAVQRNGETVLRPAEMTVASELVSLVARTGELRNIRDCDSEPLCWLFSPSNGPSGSPLGSPPSGLSLGYPSASPPGGAQSPDYANGYSSAVAASSSHSPLTPSHSSSQGYFGGGHSNSNFGGGAGHHFSLRRDPKEAMSMTGPLTLNFSSAVQAVSKDVTSIQFSPPTTRPGAASAPPVPLQLPAASSIPDAFDSPPQRSMTLQVNTLSPLSSSGTSAANHAPLTATSSSSLMPPSSTGASSFLTPQHHLPSSSSSNLLTRESYSASKGEYSSAISNGPKGLFDRAHSVGAQPNFKLRNCLCVPVRGNAGQGGANGKENNHSSTQQPPHVQSSPHATSSAAGDLHTTSTSTSASGGNGNTSTSSAAAATGKVVAVIQACNKRSGAYFTSEDVQILQFVGLLAGQSLSNASLYEEALVRRRQQEALCTMIELMSAETGVDEVIECIIDAAYRLLEVDRISLYMVDENKNQLVCKVSKDPNAIGQRLPLKYGLIGIVAAEGKAINISDCSSDPRCKDILTLDKVTGYSTRNILTLPIQDNKNRVAAVIQVINKKGVFTLEDETLMQSLSRSAGQILRKAQLFSALLVEQRKTKALMAILQAEESEVSIESLLDRILQTTHDVLPCMKVALFFVDAVREDFYALVSDAPKTGAGKKAAPPVINTNVSSGGGTGSTISTPTAAGNSSTVASAKNFTTPGASPTSAGPSPSPTTLNPPPNTAASSPLSAAVTPTHTTTSTEMERSASPLPLSTGSKKKSGPGGRHPTGTTVPGSSATKHLSFPLKKGLAGWAAEQGQLVNVVNAAADPRFDPSFDKLVSEGSKSIFRTRSSLCVPLHNTTGTTIAVLQAINRLKKKEGSSSGASDIIAFSEEDEEIFKALCTQAGITLRRRLTEVLLGRSRRELGDDKQINSLFELYGSNYWNTSSGPGHGGGGHAPSSSNAMSSVGPFAGLDNTADSSLSPSNSGGTSGSFGHSYGTLNFSIGGGSSGGNSSQNQEKRAQRRKTLSEASSYKKFILPPKSPSGTPSVNTSLTVSTPVSTTNSAASTPHAVGSLSVGSTPTAMRSNRRSTAAAGLPPIPSSPSPAPSSHGSGGSVSSSTPGSVTSPSPATHTPSSSIGGGLVISGSASATPTPLASPKEVLHNAWMTPAAAKSETNTAPPSSSSSSTSSPGLTSIVVGAPLATVNSETSSPALAAATSPSGPMNLSPPRSDVEEGAPLSLSRPVSLDRLSSCEGDSLSGSMDLSSSHHHLHAPPAQGAVSNKDEVAFIYRKAGVRWSSQSSNTSQSGGGGAGSGDDSKAETDEEANEAHALALALQSRPVSVQDKPKYSWPILPPSNPFAIDISILQSIDTFNVFDYTEDQLIHCSLMLLNDLGLVGDFGLPLTKLQNFLVAVRYNYNNNSYHNYFHGFGVMHFAYWMLRKTDAGTFLPKLDQLSLLLAALCHDIDHPGTTNGFQIASGSDLALAHNDQAVLENHHAFVTFELLRDPDMNVLTPCSDATESGENGTDGPKWSLQQFRSFRKTVISAILATDMSKHFDLCRKLDGLEPHCDSLDTDKEEDRQFIIDLLTHCADLSGQVLPYHIAVLWESRLTQEFIWQANMEQRLGLPVSTFMQGLNDNTIRFKNHLNFIDFVMSPLWMGMVELFPPLSVCVKNLLENRKAFMRFIPVEALAPPARTQTRSPTTSEPCSPSGGPSDSPGKPLVERSVTVPYRSLRVGLLRQQRGHSPPQNVRSNSFSLAGDEERAFIAAAERASSAADTTTPTPKAISPVPLSTPLIPMCTHRDVSNAKDAGFCHLCAADQNMPEDVMAIFTQGSITPSDMSHGIGSHRRKGSAPLSLSGPSTPVDSARSLSLIPGHPGHSHTLSTPNAILLGPHSRQGSHSSDDLLSPPGVDGESSHSHSSHSHSPQPRGNGFHARVHSFSETVSPVAPESPQLNALLTQEHRRQHSLNITARKAARWNALTSASGEPVKALPIGASGSKDFFSHDSQSSSSNDTPPPSEKSFLASSMPPLQPRPPRATTPE